MEIIIGVATLIIATFGIWIMIQQKKLSDKQLKLSHFDKYYKLFSVSEDFIVKILMGWVTVEECTEYFKQMNEAEYLFSPELDEFITKIHSYGLELAELKSNIEVYARNLDNLSEQNRQERKHYMAKKSVLLKSIPPLRDELKMRFESFLSIK